MTETIRQADATEEPFRIRLRKPAMASYFEVILDGDRDERELQGIADEAYELVLRLEQQLSVHNPTSEVSWLNQMAAERPIAVEAGLFDLLVSAKTLWRETGGAFDPTIGPLAKCWGFYARKGRVPSAEEIAAARSRVGFGHVALEPERRRVRFLRPGMELNLGGVGKGYVVDRVVEYLRGRGVVNALVQTGGSTVFGMGAPPISADGWRAGVRPGGEDMERLGYVSLSETAYSTSGDYEQRFEAEGVRYGHILDPRTGWPARRAQAACALSRTAARADALSTAFAVLSEAEVRAYAVGHGDGAALVSENPLGELVIEAIGCIIRRFD